MFTDEVTTPKRIEALLELLYEFRDQPLTAPQIDRMLQPDPDSRGDRSQAKSLRSAAKELGLATINGEVWRLAKDASFGDPSSALLNAFDERVLASTDIEPYFAPFYSYVLGSGKAGATYRKSDQWVGDFLRDVELANRSENPFNKTKISGMYRWLEYVGLGWFGPDGAFQPNPYYRLRRRMPKIFAGQRRLSDRAFMEQLANECPELDGGAIFMQANSNRYEPAAKRCTLGLAHALVDLHGDGIIRLECPPDHDGWSVAECEPQTAYDAHTFVSPRMRSVELIGGN